MITSITNGGAMIEPHVVVLLKGVINIEEKYKDKDYGWEAYEVGGDWRDMRKLMKMGLVVITSKSNRHTLYRATDIERIRQIVEEFEAGKTDEEEYLTAKIDIPDNLFDLIEGYDDVKFMIKKNIKNINNGKKPIHFLLIGPPATAKSLIIDDLMELEHSLLLLGGGMTSAGVRELLIERKPIIVGIDEIDKLDAQYYEVLLSLCEKGMVKVDVHDRHQQALLQRTMVVAACNTTYRIPPEVMSRFMKFRFKHYTEDEFIRVVKKIATQHEGKDEEFADVLSKELLKKYKHPDPRDAIRLCRIADDIDELLKVIEIMDKYK